MIAVRYNGRSGHIFSIVVPLLIPFDNFVKQRWLVSDETLRSDFLADMGVWHLGYRLFVKLAVKLFTLVVV